jgi:hypothetical protein
MQKTRNWQINERSTVYNGNTMRWPFKDEITTDKWKNSGQMLIKSKQKLGCHLPRLLSVANILTKMAEHLKMSEGELNELLAEYWKLRHETGILGS